ncbi:MAG TPA: DegT/DnrJ/EryC1/StrS family aminotransferase [Blastocatellia bacterium]|nr:DegT/DnrJ/EryC1/StrS family aminotransferase [Blastocatellia bacterium]
MTKTIEEKRVVPMLDLKAQHQGISAEVEAAVKSVLESQQFILGPEVRELESEIAAYCECSYAIGCASGSDALLLALMACGVGEGDEVITSPFTFFATAGSVARLGARPVFVDIEPSTFNLDEDRLESAITQRTRAIMPVHLFGQCADMDKINKMAERHGLAVIEDAAQAIGALDRGRRAGSLGLIAAFSFYPSKNLGGAGDGGMLTTNAPGLAERLRRLRAHGAKNKYFHEEVGINSRLDSLQAAILRVKLRRLDEWAEARRANARRYEELFSESGLLQDGIIELPSMREDSFHVFNQFVIRARDRDRLKQFLKEEGIGSEVYYPLSLHQQDCFKYLGYKRGDFPESERAAAEALAIPIYPELGESAQVYVVGRVKAFYNL